MRVKVRVFARLRELAGRGDWDDDVDDPDGHASAATVWQTVVRRHPALAPFGGSISCAVNANFARMTTAVHDGDEVAFLPPVSGG
jgi:molybdopterin synthase sulfur carrier subunit